MSVRLQVASLSLSAAALVTLVMQEGYTNTAVVPVEGDRWTVGFGSTVRDDGTAVQPGDTITPPQAVKRTLAHVQKDEAGIRRCVTAPLSQAEYDLMADFAYQYGAGRLCTSGMVREANAGRYAESCTAYLDYRYVAGYDCSTTVNGKRNKRCWGVWERTKARYDTCKGQL